MAIKILDKAGYPVSLTEKNLILEAVRDKTEVEWYAKRLRRRKQSFIIVKDTDGMVWEDGYTDTDHETGEDKEVSSKKSAVIYRLYSDSKLFTGG